MKNLIAARTFTKLVDQKYNSLAFKTEEDHFVMLDYEDTLKREISNRFNVLVSELIRDVDELRQKFNHSVHC